MKKVRRPGYQKLGHARICLFAGRARRLAPDPQFCPFGTRSILQTVEIKRLIFDLAQMGNFSVGRVSFFVMLRGQASARRTCLPALAPARQTASASGRRSNPPSPYTCASHSGPRQPKITKRRRCVEISSKTPALVTMSLYSSKTPHRPSRQENSRCIEIEAYCPSTASAREHTPWRPPRKSRKTTPA